MAEITKIKPQKNKKRVNIYLDGKFAFGLDADNFLKAGLKVGQELTEKQVEDLIFKNEFQKLLDKAYRILSLRPRSEKEVKDYLAKKKATPKVAQKIIAKLKKLNHLNDQEFARWWVEQRSTFRPRGKFGLVAELRQKGVAKEVIDRVIKKVDEMSLARKAAQKKIRSYKRLNPREFREKMTAFLARRGFSWSVIKVTIDDFLKKR